MPALGNFETIREFRPRRPGEEVAWYLCRPIAGDAPVELLAKLFTPIVDPLRPERSESDIARFLARAKRQRDAHARAADFWGEIEDVGRDDRSAYYITTQYEKGLNDLGKGAKPPPISLYRVLYCVVRALRSLHDSGTPGHGALHAGNVLIRGRRGGLVHDVALCDPRAEDELPPHAEADDLQQLGRLLYTLATGRPEYRSSDDVSMTASPRFAHLGKLGNAWRDTIRRLVDVSAVDGFALDSLEAHLPTLEPKPAVSRKTLLTAGVAAAMLLGAGGSAAWWFTRPPPAPEVLALREFDRVSREATSRDPVVPGFSTAVQALRVPEASASDIESWTTATRDAFKVIDSLDRPRVSAFLASDAGRQWASGRNLVTDITSLEAASIEWDRATRITASRSRYEQLIDRARSLESTFAGLADRLDAVAATSEDPAAFDAQSDRITQTLDALTRSIERPPVRAFLATAPGQRWLASVDPIATAATLGQDALNERDRMAEAEFERIVRRAEAMSDIAPDLAARVRALAVAVDDASPVEARNLRADAIVQGFEQINLSPEVLQFLATEQGSAWRAQWLDAAPLDGRAVRFVADATQRLAELASQTQAQRDLEARLTNLTQREAELQRRADMIAMPGVSDAVRQRLSQEADPDARDQRLASLSASLDTLNAALATDTDGSLAGYISSPDFVAWTTRPDALAQPDEFVRQLRTRVTDRQNLQASEQAEQDRIRREQEAAREAQELAQRELEARLASLGQREDDLQRRADAIALPGLVDAVRERLAQPAEPDARDQRLADVEASLDALSQALAADESLAEYVASAEFTAWLDRPDPLSRTTELLEQLRTRVLEQRNLEQQQQQTAEQRQLADDWAALRRRAAEAGEALRDPTSQQLWRQSVAQWIPDAATTREAFVASLAAFDTESEPTLNSLRIYESAGDTLTQTDADLAAVDRAIGSLAELPQLPQAITLRVSERSSALEAKAIELTVQLIDEASDPRSIVAVLDAAPESRRAALEGDTTLRVEIARVALTAPAQIDAQLADWLGRVQSADLRERLEAARAALGVNAPAAPPQTLGPFTRQASNDGLLRYTWASGERTHELTFRPVPGRSDWHIAENVISAGMFVDLFNANVLWPPPNPRRDQILGSAVPAGQAFTPLSGRNPFNVIGRSNDRLTLLRTWVGNRNNVTGGFVPPPIGPDDAPGQDKPMIWLSAEDASQIAQSLGVSLPPLDVWRSAAAGADVSNQLDAATLSYSSGVERAAGQIAALRPLQIVNASLVPPDEATRATAAAANDNQFLFSDVTTNGQGFRHLLGNVFQFVQDGAGIRAVGGSGLTRLDDAAMRTPRDVSATQGYADVGVRLALQLQGGSAPDTAGVLAQVLRR